MLMVHLRMFSFQDMQKAMENAPLSVWGDGIPLKPLHKHVLKSAKSKRPLKSGKLRYTASQMRKFAIARCLILP